jgi:hypothetical protein
MYERERENVTYIIAHNVFTKQDNIYNKLERERERVRLSCRFPCCCLYSYTIIVSVCTRRSSSTDKLCSYDNCQGKKTRKTKRKKKK